MCVIYGPQVIRFEKGRIRCGHGSKSYGVQHSGNAATGWSLSSVFKEGGSDSLNDPLAVRPPF